MREVVIGLLGAGNVGGGVVRILHENQADIERRLGASVRVKRLLVRDPDRVRPVAVSSELLTTNPRDVLEDPEIRIVVELLGGIEPARSMTLEALGRAKHVVTANKALIATAGQQLFAEAAARGVAVNFEAAVAGGIPILRALREGLASDRIERITGIVNGTCNYVLDAMTRGGVGYEDALTQAQAAGFAEADPTLDVTGRDAAQKLSLLALVGFGLRVDPDLIPTEGITRVRPFDVEAASGFGYVIKSIAEARQTPKGPVLSVQPVWVSRDDILANVHGAYNAVRVQSRAMGRSLYHGRGAGPMPTGMAVVSDIIELCRQMVARDVGRPPPEAFRTVVDARPVAQDGELNENYLCVHVTNVPGVLGRVASCLGRHGVSVKRLKQDLGGPGRPVDMVVMTERVSDASIDAAVAEIDAFDGVTGPTHRFRLRPADPVD